MIASFGGSCEDRSGLCTLPGLPVPLIRSFSPFIDRIVLAVKAISGPAGIKFEQVTPSSSERSPKRKEEDRLSTWSTSVLSQEPYKLSWVTVLVSWLVAYKSTSKAVDPLMIITNKDYSLQIGSVYYQLRADNYRSLPSLAAEGQDPVPHC